MSRKRLPEKSFKWSPHLAYAIGLIATDGNLSKDGRHISFRSVDIEQIKNFKKCLELKNKIESPSPAMQYGNRICYRVQFGNIQFHRWLQSIGLSPAKTYTIKSLQIPDKYFRDFLRGHLDGDGSITTYQDTYNTYKHPEYIYTRLFVRFISASKNHIKWIRTTVKRLLNIQGDLHETPPARGRVGANMWRLKFMKKESLKLIPWLYYSQNIPCLKRKRAKAEQAAKIIQNITRKKYTKKS